ncbi:MAG: hypothetical protein V4510_13495 [bacterium]
MPQIPGIDFGQRPDARVERAASLPVDGGSKAIGDVADAVGDIGMIQARQQAAQQKAIDEIDAKKQAIVDNVNATKNGLDFSVMMSKLAEAKKDKYFDDHNPRQAQEDFVKESRLTAEAILKTPGMTPAEALKTSEMNSATIARYAQHLDAWGHDRMTQQAKGNLTGMTNQASALAEQQPNGTALAQFTETFLKDTAKMRQALHGNPEQTAQETRAQFAEAYARVQGKDNPTGVSAELRDQNSYVSASLPAAKRDHLGEMMVNNLGHIRTEQVRKALLTGNDDLAKTRDLLATGQLDPGTVFSLLKKNDQEVLAAKADPNLDEDSLKQKLESLQLTRDGITAADSMARPHGASRSTEEGSAALANLQAQSRGLFGRMGHNQTEDLQQLQKFQVDLMRAKASNIISDQAYNAMHKSVALSFDKAVEEESSAGSQWKITTAIKGLFNDRAGRQAGDEAMVGYLGPKSVLGRFSQDQQNAAWTSYMEQFNDHIERTGGQPTEKQAQDMALNAARYAHRADKVAKPAPADSASAGAPPPDESEGPPGAGANASSEELASTDDTPEQQ